MEWSDKTNSRSQGRPRSDVTENYPETQRGCGFLHPVSRNGNYYNGVNSKRKHLANCFFRYVCQHSFIQNRLNGCCFSNKNPLERLLLKSDLIFGGCKHSIGIKIALLIFQLACTSYGKICFMISLQKLKYLSP